MNSHRNPHYNINKDYNPDNKRSPNLKNHTKSKSSYDYYVLLLKDHQVVVEERYIVNDDCEENDYVDKEVKIAKRYYLRRKYLGKVILII